MLPASPVHPLNIASAQISATTYNGNQSSSGTGDLYVGNCNALAIDINLTALGGTSPTYTLTVNRKGLDGIYYPIYTGSAISTAQKISLSLGPGCTTGVALGDNIQIVETLGGTTPTATRSISVIGT